MGALFIIYAENGSYFFVPDDSHNDQTVGEEGYKSYDDIGDEETIMPV